MTPPIAAESKRVRVLGMKMYTNPKPTHMLARGTSLKANSRTGPNPSERSRNAVKAVLVNAVVAAVAVARRIGTTVTIDR